MDCAGNTTYDSFTRYRSAAMTSVGQVARWAGVESTVLLLAVSLLWGFIAYTVLTAIS